MLVCVFSTFLHARPRVQRAPGFPAPSVLSRAERTGMPRAKHAARRRTCVFRRSIDPTSPACGEENSRQASSPDWSARGSVELPVPPRAMRVAGSGVGGVSAGFGAPTAPRGSQCSHHCDSHSPASLRERGEEPTTLAQEPVAYTSTLALSALSWMNSRRGSTTSPISLVKMSSASSTSLTLTCSSERAFGVERGLPELLGVHLAEAFVALQRQALAAGVGHRLEEVDAARGSAVSSSLRRNRPAASA